MSLFPRPYKSAAGKTLDDVKRYIQTVIDTFAEDIKYQKNINDIYIDAQAIAELKLAKEPVSKNIEY